MLVPLVFWLLMSLAVYGGLQATSPPMVVEAFARRVRLYRGARFARWAGLAKCFLPESELCSETA
jgi:hypothetical protein